MALASSNHLFRRCVQCPPGTPSCPSCAVDEQCSLISQSCDSCASTTCVKIGSLPGQAAPKKSTPIGPIVGGVVGGIVVLAAVVYLLYRFYFRQKRQEPIWDPPEKRDPSTLARNRQSTRSGHSIASTVLTRASNVIQIAYIPGVTVRSPPDSPGLPPPLIPAMPGSTAANSAASSPGLEQHFFMPRDLRDSTWSDASSMDARFSVAPSLARQSVATTIYGRDAIVPPVPAVQAFRAQANVVSVKSGSNTPGSSSTPNSRTPQMPQARFANSNSSIVARSVIAKPVEIKKINSAGRVPTMSNLAKDAAKKSATTSISSKETMNVFVDEKEVVASPTATTPSTIIEDFPVSPLVLARHNFSSTHSARSSSVSGLQESVRGPTHRHTGSATLSALIEDSINRARDPQHMGVTSPTSRPDLKQHDSSPFSDANEVKENLP